MALATSPPWASLPDIPGGWRTESFAVGECRFELVLPADPDAFLSDPAVLAAHQRDDYMPYWCTLWPAALDFARELSHAPWPEGTEVLELGCGIGLVGLAGLARGWRVTFTDYDRTAVACALTNASRHGYGATAQGYVLDWRQPHGGPWPVILGCDLLYETRNHAPLLNLLEQLLAAGGVFWIADPGRRHAVTFVDTALDRGFRVRVYGAGGQPVLAPSPCQFQVLELTR